jgi:hypothetical protein
MHFAGRPLGIVNRGRGSVFIEPAFYQRIMAATSRRAVIVAMMVGLLLWMSYDWVITTLGITAHTAIIQGIISEPSGPEQAVTHFVIHVLPAGLLSIGLLSELSINIKSGSGVQGSLVQGSGFPALKRHLKVATEWILLTILINIRTT